MNWMVPHAGGCHGRLTIDGNCENETCGYQGEGARPRTGPDDPGLGESPSAETKDPTGTLAEQCWDALQTCSFTEQSTDTIQRFIDLAVSEARDMIIHCLKTWPEPFEALWNGHKNYEYRKNDRDFHTGDELVLQEWDPDTNQYSGRSLKAKVLYIDLGPDWGIAEGHCCMALSKFYGHKS